MKVESFSLAQNLKVALIEVHRYFKPQSDKLHNGKPLICSYWHVWHMTAIRREKRFGKCCSDEYSWKEETKTRAVSSLVTTWFLICLHCLEMYMLKNSGIVSEKEIQFCYLSTLCLTHCSIYYLIIQSVSSSSSFHYLLSTNGVYYVSVLNFSLKKKIIQCFSDYQVNETSVLSLKKWTWCHSINCNLK